MLSLVYFGASVSGAVLLLSSLLVERGRRPVLRSLRVWGFALAGFGLSAVAMTALAILDPSTTLPAAAGVGAACALIAALLR